MLTIRKPLGIYWVIDGLLLILVGVFPRKWLGRLLKR